LTAGGLTPSIAEIMTRILVSTTLFSERTA
jgi:hypothetical protein